MSSADQDLLDEPALPEAKKREEGAVAPDPEVGDEVAGFALLERLGKGGAGSVFKARSPQGEIVALKVLSASKAKRARIVQRFFDEVRAAGAVAHPGLIKVIDFIEEESPRRLAYSMEYLDGEPMRARLQREGTVPLREAISIATQICDALSALHAGGIIHRDLKPENIMLVPKGATVSVKLVDFGVVKFLPIDRSVPRTERPGLPNAKPGTFVGTPRYMAPEQAAGAQVDVRADLFSVGVMLFEMITGECPHEGESLRDVVMAKLKGAPRITTNPENEVLPQELTDIVDACLRLKPVERPQDAATVAASLREADMVLFAVGAIKVGADGSVARGEGESEVERPLTRTPPPEVTAPASSAAPPAKPASAKAPPPAPSVETPANAVVEARPKTRWSAIVLVVLGMLVAAVAIAMIAHKLNEEEPLLLVPIAPNAPGAKAPNAAGQ